MPIGADRRQAAVEIVQEKAIEIVARPLGRDREPRLRKQLECLLARQLAAPGLGVECERWRELVLWDGGKPKPRAPADDTRAGAIGGDRDLPVARAATPP